MAVAFGPLADPAWLAGHLREPDVRLIDLRWYLDGRSGRDAYLAGHIPSAIFVDLDAITGTDGPGRHPLPQRDRFQAAMRGAGLHEADRVVVYDDQGGFSAARLWWLLRYFGHRLVAVLDGGLPAWNGPVERDLEAVEEGDFVAAEPDRSMVVDDSHVAGAAAAFLVDARAGERFRGEIEPIDPRAGHIPGAVNVPWRSNLDQSWRFLPPAVLREKYAAAAAAPETIAYCGSGVSACVDLLAMEVAGIRGARLYEGSWSDWSSRDRPIATG